MSLVHLLLALVAPHSQTPSEHTSPPSVHVVPLQLEARVGQAKGELTAQPVEYTVEFAGMLHVWTRSAELDLGLRVEDGHGKLLAEDEDSGGGKTPYLALLAAKEQRLSVHVGGARLTGSAGSAKSAGAGGSAARSKDAANAVELCFVPAPEDSATRQAASRAHARLEEIAGLEKPGSLDVARQEVTALVDELLAVRGAEASELVCTALCEAGGRADSLGDLKPSSKAWKAVVEHRERVLPEDHPDLQIARLKLAATIGLLGDLAGARALQEKVLEIRSRTLAEDHFDLQQTRLDLSQTLRQLGDLAAARALQVPALEALTRTRPDDDVELQKARLKLSGTLRTLGDLAGARTMQEKAAEILARKLPEHAVDLCDARCELAMTRYVSGDLTGARGLFEKALEGLACTLPAEHPYLVQTQGSLAGVLLQLGDPAGAHVLNEKVLDVCSRTLPDDHPDLQTARNNLAATAAMLGDLDGARRLMEKALEVRSRTLPEDHPELQKARHNMGLFLRTAGDLASARVLIEVAYEVLSRTMHDDHPDLQVARVTLGSIRMELGDFAAARPLIEKALEISSRTLPADHPNLQVARSDLAVCLQELGDFQGARALQEKALEVWSRTARGGHSELWKARHNLAVTLYGLGDMEGAFELLEQVVEDFSRAADADHPDLQKVRLALGAVLQRLGDATSARELEEQALEVLARTHPDGHYLPQRARASLAWTLGALGEREPALRLASELGRIRREAIGSARGALSPRELEEQVAHASPEISTVLSLALGARAFEPSPALQSEAFALVESARSVGLFCASLSASVQSSPELDALRVEERKRSAALVNLAQSGAGREAIAGGRQALDLVRRKRQEFLAADPSARATMIEPTLENLSTVLGPKKALVSYWRAMRRDIDDEQTRSEDLLCFVACPGAALALVDLGPVQTIALAIERWRQAILAPVERGLSAAGSAADPGGLESGRALRALVFDPLRAALGDARHFIVALDDALHAVPLDALPEEDGLLGERFEFEQHLSLRELLWPRSERPGADLLVALGGASFNSPPNVAASGAQDGGGHVAVAERGIHAALQETVWQRGFEPLTQTLAEARGIAALHEEAFGQPDHVVVLEKHLASRESLEELAPRARFLHLATHGWFAAESVPSSVDLVPLDREVGSALALSLGEEVRGLSPMILCGLALAGANLERDELGRVPGLITAEEIATLDLAGCELAVLSACDTHVGVRRAGQGVASLQKALHMAGARSVITSLWKVPDEATKELMLDFYRRLWVEKKPTQQALWEAKMKLRAAKDERGAPLYSIRDWAAWVLTGSPD